MPCECPDAEKCECNQYDVDWIKQKFRTRLSWSVSMFILGSLNVLAAWLNYVDLSNEQLDRGLVIGPPTFIMWLMLLLFTVLSTILYVPETLNTFSVFLHQHGRPVMPLIYELIITISAIHIPLSAINYFVARCRRQYTTTYQTLCGTFSIIFIFVRIIWYAHLEGKLLKLDEKRKMKIGMFMIVSSVYAMSMAFYVMNWRSGPSSVLLEGHVKNISIYMLKAPFLENEYIHQYSVNHVLKLQGWSLQEPELVPSVLRITQAGHSGVLIGFNCNPKMEFIPMECQRSSNINELLFYFRYLPEVKGGPFGEVSYNLAELHHDGECKDIGQDLQDGWRLWYFNTLKLSHRGNPNITITAPWTQSCTSPRPWYDHTLPVCGLYSDFLAKGGSLGRIRGILAVET